jgi:hypothetical protein
MKMLGGQQQNLGMFGGLPPGAVISMPQSGLPNQISQPKPQNKGSQ